MLIDVNLLPKKEPKNIVLLVSFLLLFALMLAGGVFFYFSVQQANEQVGALTQQLKQLRALEAAEQQKLQNVQSQNEVQELKKTVEWAQQYPLKTVRLLRELAKQLPERGFFMNFSYTEDGAVKITVQFDTSEDAAYYLKRLEASAFIADVQLKSVTTASAQNEDKTEERDVLPRYLAQYELHVNKNALNEKKEQ